MKKSVGIVTSLFAVALALSACTGPRDVQRAPEPVNNKAYEKTLELKDSKQVDSTTELDGKKFTVKSIGPVAENADGLPSADKGERRIGVTFDNQISPASSASASVDGMPQELLGVKSGEGTIVVIVPDNATDAYALISFGTKGAISINLLDGKATAKKPPTATSIPDGKLPPATDPVKSTEAPYNEVPKTDEELGEAPSGTNEIQPGNVVPAPLPEKE